MTESGGGSQQMAPAAVPATQAPAPDPAYVVGIGSSAGGLEALRPLIRALQPDADCALVIAQHLSPQHESLMTPLLARETDIPVQLVEDGAPLRRGHIYVTPPNADVTVLDGCLRLHAPGSGHGPRPSVNLLLQSLARERGNRAIGVVLSGTGSDGADGMRALKAVEGLTIVQEPASAKYDSMPLAAIRMGAADLILAPDRIGLQLNRLSRLPAPLVHHEESPPPAPLLEQVIRRIHEVTGYNFHFLKDSTLTRQLDRRVSVLRLPDRETYLRELAENPREVWLLQRNLLVSVTAFFRDPKAFDALGEVLRQGLHRLPHDRELRLWVAGCATGEEAYSMAILAARSLGGPRCLRRLKVFATDIDEIALDQARRGIFHAGALEGLERAILDSYFVPHAEGWRVIDALKEATVFARHNLESDPPFTRIDLVSCRNTLIYFKTPLQEQVLRKFHYALNPDGHLFLGSAETLGLLSHLFSPLDAHHRIFQRSPSADRRPRFSSPGNPTGAHPTSLQRERPRRPDERAGGDYLPGFLQEVYAPPSLLLDDNLQVKESFGDISLICELPRGRMRAGIFDLLRPDLRQTLRLLLMQLRTRDGTRHSQPVRLEQAGHITGLRIVGRRLLNSAAGNGYVLSFEELSGEIVVQDPAEATDPDGSPAEQQLRLELVSHRESLQSSLQELETANEELQAMNEELQAATEELQASNEELETTNEELQAANEELTTVNQELQVRSSELSAANHDLEGILQAISHGVVIIDRDLRITRHSANATRVFGFVSGDVGRKLADIPCHIDIQNLENHLLEVIRSGQRAVLEIDDPRACYLLQIEPDRDGELGYGGAILAFSDISELRHAQQALATSNQNFQTITEALREVVWVWSPDLQFLLYASPRLADLLGRPVGEFPLANPYHHALIHPDDRQRVWQTLQARRAQGWNLEYRLALEDGGECWVQDTGSPLRNHQGQITSVVGSLVDVGERKRAELEIREIADFHEALFNNPLVAIGSVNRAGRLVQVNRAFCEFLGHPLADLLGKHFREVTHAEDIPADEAEFEHLLNHRKARYVIEKRFLHRSGAVRWGEVTVQRLDTPNRLEAFTVAMVKDVTERKQWEIRLAQQANTDQLTGLPNRNRFLQELQRELSLVQRGERQVAVLFLDLDGFKEVNDAMGHNEGDRVLREMAGRIRYQTRRENLVARLGGDEFALLLRDMGDLNSITQAVERLLAHLAEPLQLDQVPVHLSGSIGIALAPLDSTQTDELMRMADTAMYAAKQAGGNRLSFYSSNMNEGLKRHLALKHTIKQLLERKAFYPIFQPVVNLQDRQVVFMEALLRWPGDSALDVGVEELVGFCETSGLIQHIGQSIFHQALEQVVPLRQRFGPQVRVGVNLSVRQLEDPAFRNAVLHLSPVGAYEMLVVEITESLLMEQRGQALEVLEAFRQKGAWLAIDDFGKGYSSLGRLEKIRPEIIKIDGNLLPRDGNDRMRQGFCEAITVMARGMNARVVAEGIETVSQLAFVQQLGCDYGQGYLFARPGRLEHLLPSSGGIVAEGL